MPTPEQMRKQRIENLLEWAKEQEPAINVIDPILQKCREMFPLLSNETAHSYSHAVLRLLQQGA